MVITLFYYPDRLPIALSKQRSWCAATTCRLSRKKVPWAIPDSRRRPTLRGVLGSQTSCGKNFKAGPFSLVFPLSSLWVTGPWRPKTKRPMWRSPKRHNGQSAYEGLCSHFVSYPIFILFGRCCFIPFSHLLLTGLGWRVLIKSSQQYFWA